MWVTRFLFEMIVKDNKSQQLEIQYLRGENRSLVEVRTFLIGQKAKDDITIDWMRHRINALEKERAILLNKTANIVLPVPEIVPTRPGTVSPLPVELGYMPDFEDVGEDRAAAMGIQHDDAGGLKYGRPYVAVPDPAPLADDGTDERV